MNPLLNLPDDVFYIIITYINKPTYRASILCHQIAPLNSSFYQSIEKERSELWSMILKEYNSNNKNNSSNTNHIQKRKNIQQPQKRRTSKRLRLSRTMKKEVHDAHLRIYEQTEIAHYVLTECIHSKNQCLSLKQLRYLLNRYGGPLLRYNHQAAVGGTFLIECCRARHVKESVILSCVRELIEKRGALPDVSSGIVKSGNKKGLTPLCIAAARGMPSVVDYLLKHGASYHLEGSGSFRLFSNPMKSISGTLTPLAFAKKMMNAEIENGVDMQDLRLLRACIQLLSKKDQNNI